MLFSSKVMAKIVTIPSPKIEFYEVSTAETSGSMRQTIPTPETKMVVIFGFLRSKSMGKNSFTYENWKKLIFEQVYSCTHGQGHMDSEKQRKITQEKGLIELGFITYLVVKSIASS